MKGDIRINIWKQHTNSADRPWRRKNDRQFGFKFVHRPGGSPITWNFVMETIGRHAVVIRHHYDRHYRCQLVTVYIGTRAFLKERFKR